MAVSYAVVRKVGRGVGAKLVHVAASPPNVDIGWDRPCAQRSGDHLLLKY